MVNEGEKRLLFVITDLEYGGAERQLVLLATRLIKRGWLVKVVSILPPRAFVDELEEAGIEVETLGVTQKWQFLQAWFRLRKIIAEWKPHIVHSFMVHANILSRLVRLRDKRYKLVCSARNVDEEGRLREWLYRLTDPFCELTTQVSKKGVKRYIAIRAVSPGKILYLPNGIDPAPFFEVSGKKERFRKQFGIGTKDFLWLAVGRLAPQKDYPTLLKAFAELVKGFNNARLWIAGEGSLRKALENLTQSLGLEGSVCFLGLRKDIPELMAAADAFVLSSAWEGMPNVLLEASASGLPIVSTRVSGTEEIVIDGETGYLVPPGKPSALAEAMRKVMTLSPDERKRMGEAARRCVEEYFHIERVVDRWEEVYRKLLGDVRAIYKKTT